MIAHAVPPAPPAIHGFLPEIAAASERLGWPHIATEPERFALSHLVMVTYIRGTGSIRCAFGRSMATSACRVKRQTRGRVTAEFRVDVKAFEDGALVMRRVNR